MCLHEIRIDDRMPSKVVRYCLLSVALCAAPFSIVLTSSVGFTDDPKAAIKSSESNIHTFEDLQQAAARLATQPFEESPALPNAWSKLTYDEYRKVVFDPNRAIWRSEGAPFFLEAFHRGFVHKDRVTLHSISNGSVETIPFKSSLFDYRGSLDGTSLVPDFGFAGFRLVGKFPAHSDWQEMLTFLGASYFRARTASGVYGASARGMAIDVGMNKPEEFPVFRSFWIQKPLEWSTTVRLLALMDSPSVVGAYQFQFNPGANESTLDVDATLFLRHAVERVGFAPLTSMWMWGDGLAGPREDERPEVHDSDALLMHCSTDQQDEWTCRSLMRQNYPSIVQYPQTKLLGFGLAQRDTQLDHFNDNEAKYHLRPSIWVEPTTEWGSGAIYLLELPAEHEGIDNIAVWWTPSDHIAPQTAFPLSYRVTFASGDPTKHSLLKVIAHRVARPEGIKNPYVIGLDFASGMKTAENIDFSNVEVVSSGVRCQVESTKVGRNEDGSHSISLSVVPSTDTEPFELKVQLFRNSLPISEVWSYLCPIQPPPVALPPWRQKP